MPTEIDYLTDSPAADPITGAVEGVFSHNEAHAAEAVANLIDFFRKPRNSAILEAICAQVQEVEDALFALRNAFNVDTAEGDQLDILGRLVGEGRQDRLDPEYRTAVRARILVNRSTGLLEELYAIILAVSPGATIRARELYPASLAIDVDDFGDSNLQALYRLLKQAKTAGVRLNLSGPSADVWGAVDGTPAGFTWGAVDGTPSGGLWVGGT